MKTLVLMLVLLHSAVVSATSAGMVESKLRMQFGTEFSVSQTAGVIYAFQSGVKPERQEKYIAQTQWFGSHFASLVATEKPLLRGLTVVILNGRQTYQRAFRVPGMMAHYQRIGSILYTYQMSGAGTLYHELGHHFIRVVYGEDVPLWFNEGLASYFERSINNRFGCTNWRLPIAQRAIKQKDYIPLSMLLKDNVTKKEQVFLAESRHLFVYLKQLGLLQLFLLGAKQTRGQRYKELLVELTAQSEEQLDKSYQQQLLQWQKNVYIVAAPG